MPNVDSKKKGQSILQEFERAKRKFLTRNIADPIVRAKVRGTPVKTWPKHLRRMYKASRKGL